MDMQFGNIHDYHFENFATKDSFRDILDHTCKKNNSKKYIYIGAHGDVNGIKGSVSDVNRTVIKNTLRKNIGTNIKGVFFGSCFFGNEDNAQFFFESNVGVRRAIEWVAGYGTSVDWMHSSALDIFFWSVLFDTIQKKPNTSESEIIKEVCDYMYLRLSGLMGDLQFQVYRRWPGRPYEPQALIPEL